MFAEPGATDQLALVVLYSSSRSACVVEAVYIEYRIEGPQVANTPAVSNTDVVACGSDPDSNCRPHLSAQETFGIVDLERFSCSYRPQGLSPLRGSSRLSLCLPTACAVG